MLHVKTFGHTQSGLPILSYNWKNSAQKHVLILGGVHGDEIEGVALAQALVETYLTDMALPLQLTIVPQFNLDGVLLKTRQNSRGVDLNRNLPTKDWTNKVENPRYYPGLSKNSEAENQALVQWIDREKPHFIFSLHSWKPMLNINGPGCRAVAEVINKHTGYRIDEDIGYPTPGCLGTYTGHELKIPTLTYEIERGLSLDRIVREHRTGIHEALKFIAEGKMS